MVTFNWELFCVLDKISLPHHNRVYSLSAWTQWTPIHVVIGRLSTFNSNINVCPAQIRFDKPLCPPQLSILNFLFAALWVDVLGHPRSNCLQIDLFDSLISSSLSFNCQLIGHHWMHQALYSMQILQNRVLGIVFLIDWVVFEWGQQVDSETLRACRLLTKTTS